jgi:hypothetical protein
VRHPTILHALLADLAHGCCLSLQEADPGAVRGREGERFEGSLAELHRDAAAGDAVPRSSARSQPKQSSTVSFMMPEDPRLSSMLQFARTLTRDVEAVNWVVEQLLRPGVQNGEHVDGRPDMASVASKLEDGLGSGLHQEGVAVTLVGAQRLPELLGHGDGDLEIARRQHLGLAGFEPALGLSAMTFGFGATPVLAGMIGEDLGVALFATPEPPSENSVRQAWMLAIGPPRCLRPDRPRRTHLRKQPRPPPSRLPRHPRRVLDARTVSGKSGVMSRQTCPASAVKSSLCGE